MTTNEPRKPDVPRELLPTSLPGVFTFPIPPTGFDPNTASPEELITYGYPARPSEKDHPALRAAWARRFSRWRKQKRIVPEFEPHIGKTHILREVKRIDTDSTQGSYLSSAWAGSVVQGGNCYSVSGYWTIPTVTQPGEPQGNEGGWNSSSWIGIDGTFGSNDVLQAGVEQKVDANGNATYYAWYEWFTPPQPDSPAYIYEVAITNFPVEPGQTLSCDVQYRNGPSGMYGYISLNNETTGSWAPIDLTPPPGATANGNTAEWIMEAPDYGIPNSSLPAFTPVTFWHAFCLGSGPSGITFGNPADPDPVGNTFNIEGFGTTLTSVTTDTQTCTITYIGP